MCPVGQESREFGLFGQLSSNVTFLLNICSKICFNSHLPADFFSIHVVLQRGRIQYIFLSMLTAFYVGSMMNVVKTTSH